MVSDLTGELNKAPTALQWKRIGMQRRSGVMTPLFSVYSKNSVGIADFGDMEILSDLCRVMGSSILQLLPLNDTGFSFMPYDAQSSFALDPMYLPLNRIKGVDGRSFKSDIRSMSEAFPCSTERVDYRIKSAKMELLWRMFLNSDADSNSDFHKYSEAQSGWLEDYCIYKVLQQVLGQSDWQKWPETYRIRDKRVLDDFLGQHGKAVRFHAWMQYQCWLRLRSAKKKVNSDGVYIMGDIPFLVSRSSADVWALPQAFKLHLSSGAPPDYFLESGQRWGMPPYDWDYLKQNDCSYFRAKLKYASNFYDMFRIDHAIGFFRLWTIAMEEPVESAGRNGRFDPENEAEWQKHGEDLFRMVIETSPMLPCAEDLGTVPDCSAPTLSKLGVPGMDVQRWTCEQDGSMADHEKYRSIGMAVLSTHDTLPFQTWWDSLADEEKRRAGELYGIEHPDPDAREVLVHALRFVESAPSVFAIHSIQDLLMVLRSDMDEHLKQNINYPGTFGDQNWTWRCPIALEELLENESMNVLKTISEQNNRL